MGINRTVVAGPYTAAAANNIAQSQSPGAGAITINGSLATGGVATLDQPRRVTIAPGGADSGITYTVVGTNRTGNAISETVQGVNNPSTVTTTQDFKTVTAVTHTGTVAGTVTVGTSAIGSSQWFAIDTNADPINVGIAVVVSGTINYTVEYTYDDPNVIALPTVFNISGGSLTAKTATADSQPNSFNFPCWGIRLTVNSSTSPATATMTIQQAGPYH